LRKDLGKSAGSNPALFVAACRHREEHLRRSDPALLLQRLDCSHGE
jgi:hypothetical protein